MIVQVISQHCTFKEYIGVLETDIKSIAAKYGNTGDCVELRDDSRKLISYAVWKQGDNHYSFCKNPCTNVPSDLDIIK